MRAARRQARCQRELTRQAQRSIRSGERRATLAAPVWLAGAVVLAVTYLTDVAMMAVRVLQSR